MHSNLYAGEIEDNAILLDGSLIGFFKRFSEYCRERNLKPAGATELEQAGEEEDLISEIRLRCREKLPEEYKMMEDHLSDYLKDNYLDFIRNATDMELRVFLELMSNLTAVRSIAENGDRKFISFSELDFRTLAEHYRDHERFFKFMGLGEEELMTAQVAAEKPEEEPHFKKRDILNYWYDTLGEDAGDIEKLKKRKFFPQEFIYADYCRKLDYAYRYVTGSHSENRKRKLCTDFIRLREMMGRREYPRAGFRDDHSDILHFKEGDAYGISVRGGSIDSLYGCRGRFSHQYLVVHITTDDREYITIRDALDNLNEKELLIIFTNWRIKRTPKALQLLTDAFKANAQASLCNSCLLNRSRDFKKSLDHFNSMAAKREKKGGPDILAGLYEAKSRLEDWPFRIKAEVMKQCLSTSEKLSPQMEQIAGSSDPEEIILRLTETYETFYRDAAEKISGGEPFREEMTCEKNPYGGTDLSDGNMDHFGYFRMKYFTEAYDAAVISTTSADYEKRYDAYLKDKAGIMTRYFLALAIPGLYLIRDYLEGCTEIGEVRDTGEPEKICRIKNLILKYEKAAYGPQAGRIREAGERRRTGYIRELEKEAKKMEKNGI